MNNSLSINEVLNQSHSLGRNPKLIKRNMVQEIHFYTNINDIEQVSDWDLETMHTDFISTRKAIDVDREEIVKTTQLCFLADAWDFITSNIRVFIHNGHEVYEVKEHMDIPNERVKEYCKDVRRGNNIEKLLLGGAFGEIK